MSEPVRLRKIRSWRSGKLRTLYVGGAGGGDPGTWYPDADGLRAVRDAAPELYEMVRCLGLAMPGETDDDDGPHAQARVELIEEAFALLARIKGRCRELRAYVGEEVSDGE